MHMRVRTALLVAALTLVGRPDESAGDWPQILGPLRNGRSVETATVPAWSPPGPRQIWSHSVGEGYAGPVVMGGRVIIFHRIGDQERIEALDADTGKVLWKSDFPAFYSGGIDPDTGPRCVPLIHNGQVVVLGAAGDLHCVSLEDGSVRWSKAAFSEFEAREGYFGVGSTPIVVNDLLIANIGGKQAGLVAFDVRDGHVVWKATDESASYSSPALATFDGKPCVVFVTRLNALAVRPADGTVLFRFPFGQRGPTVNAATPLVFDEFLFLSASYGIGGHLARLRPSGAETVWANDDSMSSQYSTCIYDRGYLYGFHGREDLGEVELRCLAAQTGRVQWRVPDQRPGHLILVGGRLVMLTVDGKLYLTPASPKGFDPLAKAVVSTHVTRALPAFAQGRFLFRDNRTDSRTGTLYCLELVPQDGNPARIPEGQ